MRTALCLALLTVPVLLGAQVRGVPVVVSGVVSRPTIGITIGSANEAAGGETAVAAAFATDLGQLSATAMVSRSGISDADAAWSAGFALQAGLIGGRFAPFRLTLGAGVADWSRGIVSQIHVPIAVGLAATIPNPAFAIRPWLAPRLSIRHQSLESAGTTESNFGLSGGIDLAFLNGLVLSANYDREFARGASPGILAFGLSYGFNRR